MVHDFLTPLEERGLCIQAQAGDTTARDRVIAGILPLIRHRAYRIARSNPPVDADDLVQEAVAHLVKKFNFFDCSRGLRFISYFHQAILRSMLRYIQANGLLKYHGGKPSRNPKTAAARIRHAGPLVSLDFCADSDGYTAAELLPDTHEVSALDESQRLALISPRRASAVSWRPFFPFDRRQTFRVRNNGA